MRDKNVLFVGAFSKVTKYKHAGGLMFACDTIINSLESDANWVLIDSTASTNKHRGIWERFINAIKRIFKLIKSLILDRIDIVILFSAEGFSFVEKGLMALLSKLFRKKVVFAPRSGLLLDDVSSSILFKKYVKFVLSNVDRVLCQSEFWKDYFLDLVGDDKDKYVVIHNWIDSEVYFNNKSAYMKKNTQEEIKILFLGWVTKNKGVFDIVEAADKLRNNNIKFVIAGDGDAFEDIVKLVESKGLVDKFDFRGWVKGDEKLDLFNESDIYILASYKEGYPNALMEAMASSIPVISSRVGSTPDLIQDNVNGYLFEAGNIDQLVEKILILSQDQDERIKIASKGKERIATNNTIEIGSVKFRQLLNSLF